MTSPAIHKMTIVPREPLTIQVGCLSASVYPKIDPGMSVFECVHAFQVVKSALEPLPVNMHLILDAIDTQLNCSTIVGGLVFYWYSLFNAAWFDFQNLSIMLYHDSAGDPIDNSTMDNNPSLLLPMVNGPIVACHHQDIHYVHVSFSVDYRGLVTIPTPGPTMLRAGFYIELPQLMVTLTNGNSVAYNLNLTMWQGAANLTGLTAA